MPKKKDRSGSKEGSALRARAEKRLTEGPGSNQRPGDPLPLNHELDVHRIELEMQNEELRGAQAALVASHARYFDLYDLAPVGYLTLNKKGLILEANLTAAAMLGVEKGALITKPLSRFILRDDQDIFYLSRRRLFEEGKRTECELRMTKRGGVPFWVRMEGNLAEGGDGPLCRVTISDVTERRGTEEALRKSEERYRGLFENMLDGFAYCEMVFDHEGRPHDFIYLEVNSAFERLTGLAGVGGKRVTDVIPGIRESNPELFEAYGQVALTGQPAEFEIEIAPLTRWFSVSVYSAKRGYFVAIFEDITPRRQAEQALRESETRYRSFFQNNHAVMLIIDPESGAIADANPAACAYYGWSCEELSKRRIDEINTLSPAEVHAEMKLAGSQRRDHFFFKHRLADGTIRDVEVFSGPIQLKGETMLYSIIHDVTGRRRAEEALEKARANLEIRVTERTAELSAANEALRKARAYERSLIEASLDPLVTITMDGKISDANIAAEQATGHTRNELIGTDFSDYFTEPEKARAGYLHAFREGMVRDYALNIRHRDGHTTPVLYNATVFHDETGQAIGVFAAARDMTAYRQAQAEYMRLAAALEQSAEGVLITDLDMKTVYVNPAFEGISGHDKQEIVGRVPDIFERGEGDAIFFKAMHARLAGGKAWTGRTSIEKKAGTPCEIEIAVSPIRGRSGTIRNYVVLTRDVTQQVRFERELRQAHKLEALGSLTAGIAHDFNNILAGIMGFTEMMLEDAPQDGALHRQLDLVLKGAQRGKGLVQQIRAFSRKDEPAKELVRLDLLIEEALRIMRPSLPANVEIQRHIEKTTGAVLADPTQIHQVLLNLVTNAAHAMGGMPGILRVSLSDCSAYSGDPEFRSEEMPPGLYAKLTISDTGSGMTPKVMERIFDPFFTTRAPGTGTGMGLAVVHGIVKGHNGSITVRSELGKGSSFQVFLPCVPEMSMAPAIKPAASPGGTEQILFVDDEQTLAELVRRRMERLGYKVVTALDGREALEIFLRQPGQIDLVITDYLMPGMTGFALAKELFRVRPDTPVIVCSGVTDLVPHEEARQIGVREIIAKPIEWHDFAVLVRRVLDEGIKKTKKATGRKRKTP